MGPISEARRDADGSLAPSRPTTTRAVLSVALVLLAAIPFIPATSGLATWSSHGVLFGLLAATSGVAVLARVWGALHTSLVATLYLGVHLIPFVGEAWPLPLVVLLVAYGTIVRAVPRARATVHYWRAGTFDRATVAWIVAFTLVAAGALILWRFFIAEDLGRYRQFVPTGVPTWAVFAGIIPFAMLNAAFEELIWRGIVWQDVDGAFGKRAALVVCALSFGLAHYRGFPSGAVGVGLATVYGLMMGIVRQRADGLFAPWLAHVFADIVIYTMVAAMVVLA